MLKGFEDITADITEKEKSLIPVLLLGFNRHVGKDQAVTSKEIIEGINNYSGIKLNEARLRMIINYIRHHHLPNLMASSCGYYISNDYRELLEYLESLEGRESAIRSIRINLKNYIDKKARGTQTQLFG